MKFAVMMVMIFTMSGSMLLCGCNKTNTSKETTNTIKNVEDRFIITCSQDAGGYAIYVFKDNVTGKEYFCVSGYNGLGLCEL